MRTNRVFPPTCVTCGLQSFDIQYAYSDGKRVTASLRCIKCRTRINVLIVEDSLEHDGCKYSYSIPKELEEKLFSVGPSGKEVEQIISVLIKNKKTVSAEELMKKVFRSVKTALSDAVMSGKGEEAIKMWNDLLQAANLGAFRQRGYFVSVKEKLKLNDITARELARFYFEYKTKKEERRKARPFDKCYLRDAPNRIYFDEFKDVYEKINSLRRARRDIQDELKRIKKAKRQEQKRNS